MGWDNGAWDAIGASQARADAADEERRRLRAERIARRLHVVPDPVTTATDALRSPETATEPIQRSLTPPDPRPTLSATDPRNPVDPIHALRALLQRTRDELGGPDDG